ncbi:ubiquinol-cytochrome c reductase ubiquinone-binding protein [Lycorma delicatula]|uniref:ubiquinol-cytochrome c reductase ubiquinone-binding protein n=1 Tax=Lycorma delicatula TaxID=130591 RepID=UPI003F514A53
MRLTSLLRGQEFGKIEDKVRGLVTYRISPYEQRAFAGAISEGLPNCAKRIGNVLVTVVPYFIVSYFIYSEVEKAYQKTLRKNPDDYKDDK